MKHLNMALLYVDEYDKEKWLETIHATDNDITVIDISRGDWLEQCLSQKFDVFVLRPPGVTNLTKSMFDERIQVLALTQRTLLYPSLLECQLYENKKYLAYWLQINDIPHPNTRIFYHKDDALKWISDSSFPLVGKINIGASGSGVRILRRKSEALKYVDTAFSFGLKPYIGPNFKHGSIAQKIISVFKNKGLLRRRVSSYRASFSESQYYCIFQEFVGHDFEWRVVVIGDSFFAHKKVIYRNKASGSLIKDYTEPPLSLLDFVKNIVDKFNINSVAIDIFESHKGYLINEIQCYFGQSDDFQMKVNGEIGRYTYKDKWVFEQGDFSANQCYNLRMEHIKDLLQ